MPDKILKHLDAYDESVNYFSEDEGQALVKALRVAVVSLSKIKRPQDHLGLNEIALAEIAKILGVEDGK